MLTSIVALIERGIVAQAVLTLAIWGAIGYLALSGQPIPELLSNVGLVIVGFYFRSAVSSKPTTGKQA